MNLLSKIFPKADGIIFTKFQCCEFWRNSKVRVGWQEVKILSQSDNMYKVHYLNNIRNSDEWIQKNKLVKI